MARTDGVLAKIGNDQLRQCTRYRTLASSLRTQGPIRRGLSLTLRRQIASYTKTADGYGSLRSQGRQLYKRRPLIKRDADLFPPAPDGAAGQRRAGGRKNEILRKSRTAVQIQTGAGGGKVANRAGDLPAAGRDRGGRGHGVPQHDPPFIDQGAIGGPRFDHAERRRRIPNRCRTTGRIRRRRGQSGRGPWPCGIAGRPAAALKLMACEAT